MSTKLETKAFNMLYRSDDSTPVYLGEFSKKIAILETDYPGVAQSFESFYPLAQVPIWFKNQNTLLVYFSVGTKRQMACFSLDGALLYSITDFEKGQFPRNLSKLLQPNYNNYSINHVKKIRTEDILYYEILLENRYEFLLLQLVQDELITIKRVRRYDE